MVTDQTLFSSIEFIHCDYRNVIIKTMILLIVLLQLYYCITSYLHELISHMYGM